MIRRASRIALARCDATTLFVHPASRAAMNTREGSVWSFRPASRSRPPTPHRARGVFRDSDYFAMVSLDRKPSRVTRSFPAPR